MALVGGWRPIRRYVPVDICVVTVLYLCHAESLEKSQMAYVTEDKRVLKIVARMMARKITRERAAEEIRSLPPQKEARIGYLDWEVEEALKTAKAA